MSDKELLALVDELESRVVDQVERDLDRTLAAHLNAIPDLKVWANTVMNQSVLERARNGDLAPAQKRAMKLMGAGWIVKPTPLSWPTGHRKDQARNRLMDQARGEMVGRVREALKQVTDLKVVRRNLLAKMAARVLEISEDEVLRLIDGGHT